MGRGQINSFLIYTLNFYKTAVNLVHGTTDFISQFRCIIASLQEDLFAHPPAGLSALQSGIQWMLVLMRSLVMNFPI